MVRTGQQFTRLARIKTAMIEAQQRWLSENDTAGLYGHVTHAWRIKRILDFTRDVRGEVLDLACFDGFIAEKILRQGGKEVMGVDYLDQAVERAKSRGVQAVVADLDDAELDLPDQSIDCVVAGEVLDYIYDIDSVLEEIRRVLKPKGKLIVTVHNLSSLTNRILVMLGGPPYRLGVRPAEGGRHRYFTFLTLSEVLSEHGFQVQTMESTCVACPLIYFSLYHRFFGQKPPWKRHRLLFNKTLARLFPRLGENIVALAERKT